jgi:hypothetical protein
MGKLSLKETEIKEKKLTGRLFLIVDCNQGGISNIQELKESDS